MDLCSNLTKAEPLFFSFSVPFYILLIIQGDGMNIIEARCASPKQEKRLENRAKNQTYFVKANIFSVAPGEPPKPKFGELHALGCPVEWNNLSHDEEVPYSHDGRLMQHSLVKE